MYSNYKTRSYLLNVSEYIWKIFSMNSLQQTSKVNKNSSSSKVFQESCLQNHNVFKTFPIAYENHIAREVPNGCFSHKKFRIFNHKCLNTLGFLISQMK